MKKTKNLSLEQRIIDLGTKQAKELGFDFSSYITHLIINDIAGVKNEFRLEKISNEKSENKKIRK